MCTTSPVPIEQSLRRLLPCDIAMSASFGGNFRGRRRGRRVPPLARFMIWVRCGRGEKGDREPLFVPSFSSARRTFLVVLAAPRILFISACDLTRGSAVVTYGASSRISFKIGLGFSFKINSLRLTTTKKKPRRLIYEAWVSVSDVTGATTGSPSSPGPACARGPSAFRPQLCRLRGSVA